MDIFQIDKFNEVNGRKYAHRMIRTMRTVLSREAGLSKSDIRYIITHWNPLVLIATYGEEFAGFTVGYFHNFDDEPEIKAIDDNHIYHLCLFIVHPDYQGKGLGMRFVKEQIAHARQHGARTCTCYARAGASLHNLFKVGGKIIATRENFEGGDETFSIVRIDIA